MHLTGRTIYRASARARSVAQAEFLYGFLEARDAPVLPPETSVEAGWPADFTWPDAGVARLGFSVVAVRPFRQLTQALQREPAEPSSPVWRRNRRDQLRALFKELPPRRLELFPSLDREAPSALQAAFRPGGWFLLVISPPGERRNAVLGQISGPGDIPPTAMSLNLMTRVSRFERARLRKVFSLDHLDDFGREGPEGEPDPSPPITPLWSPKGVPSITRAPVVIFGAARLPAESAWDSNARRDQALRESYKVDEGPAQMGFKPLLAEN